MNKKNVIVNSWNEWDPLKHVIVGRADGCCIPAPEPALDAKVPEVCCTNKLFTPISSYIC